MKTPHGPLTVYQVCTETVMDTSDPDIKFDHNGVSNHYYEFHARRKLEVLTGLEGEEHANEVAQKIKYENRKKKYDCLIGLSGGVDSSFVAYICVHQLGLRPLAIHLDNGWNTELAVSNIANIVRTLDIDLHTEVLDWREFRELQKAFFRSSVGNVEMVTDHAINATLFNLTRKFGVRHIISGSNLNSEGILQSAFWGHDNKDWVNINDINKRCGTMALRQYPKLTPFNFAASIFLRGVRFLPILNYLDYNKAAAIAILENELGWRNYGRKHGESTFTRFFQEYYLPEKFNVDKRRSHLSSLICSGQISRKEALDELNRPLFEEGEKDRMIKYVCKKLQFNRQDWAGIMKAKPVPHSQYKTSKILSVRQNRMYKYGRMVATGRNSL